MKATILLAVVALVIASPHIKPRQKEAHLFIPEQYGIAGKHDSSVQDRGIAGKHLKSTGIAGKHLKSTGIAGKHLKSTGIAGKSALLRGIAGKAFTVQPPPSTTTITTTTTTATTSTLCDLLCKEGEGGSLCDCGGDLPPAMNPDHVMAHIRTLPELLEPELLKSSAVKLAPNPDHVLAHYPIIRTLPELPKSSAVKVAHPVPPPGAKWPVVKSPKLSDLCTELCKSGEPGSLCSCNDQPPARNGAFNSKKDSSVLCDQLCRDGTPGSLCECNDLPPATMNRP